MIEYIKFIKNNKLLIILVLIVVGAFLGYLLDPTLVFENKWIENSIDFHGNENKWVGSFMVQGLYKSQGAISSNHPIEIYIYKVEYYLEKEYFKDYIGKDDVWPNYINVSLCPENALAYGDQNWIKPYCIEVTLNKSEDETRFIRYDYSYYGYGYNPQKVVQFLTSGKQSLIVTSKFRSPIIIENAFEIEPSMVNIELQLNRFVFWLSIITLIGVIVQIMDWICSEPENSSRRNTPNRHLPSRSSSLFPRRRP